MNDKAKPQQPPPSVPVERKDGFTNKVPGLPATRGEPVSTPQPPPAPKRDTIRTGPKKAD